MVGAFRHGRYCSLRLAFPSLHKPPVPPARAEMRGPLRRPKGKGFGPVYQFCSASGRGSTFLWRPRADLTGPCE
jgi:hypothetical protein